MKDSKCPTCPERSRIMASVRSRGNASTELAMIKALRSHGVIGWRRHLRLILGADPARGWDRSTVRPDFAFPRNKLAVFVDGDFWHGHPRNFRQPKANEMYWKAKIEANRKRDLQVTTRLRMKGWKVLRVWESALRSNPDVCAVHIARLLEPDHLRV